MVALRLATHDSGPGWFATPFPYDSFIHNSTPVYPGALNNLLENGGITKSRQKECPRDEIMNIIGGFELCINVICCMHNEVLPCGSFTARRWWGLPVHDFIDLARRFIRVSN